MKGSDFIKLDYANWSSKKCNQEAYIKYIDKSVNYQANESWFIGRVIGNEYDISIHPQKTFKDVLNIINIIISLYEKENCKWIRK